MGGIQFSFPRTAYGGAGVHYFNDQDWWSSNRKSDRGTPAQDWRIRDFMLTINRSTLQPPTTKADVYSYARNFRAYNDADVPSACSRWLDFIFSPQLYQRYGDTLEGLFDQQTASAKRFVGAISRKSDAYGLQRWSADREGGSVRKLALTKGVVEVFDTWYISPSGDTLISCWHDSHSFTLLKMSCTHYFEVPALKAIAKGGYFVTADVADWRTIQSAFKMLAVSYVVNSR